MLFSPFVRDCMAFPADHNAMIAEIGTTAVLLPYTSDTMVSTKFCILWGTNARMVSLTILYVKGVYRIIVVRNRINGIKDIIRKYAACAA